MLTSNRDPSEWLAVMADPLLAQSAVDRLKSAAWELVIEGESYRQHEKPTLSDPTEPHRRPPATPNLTPARPPRSSRQPAEVDAKWSHAAGNGVVP